MRLLSLANLPIVKAQTASFVTSFCARFRMRWGKVVQLGNNYECMPYPGGEYLM